MLLGGLCALFFSNQDSLPTAEGSGWVARQQPHNEVGRHLITPESLKVIKESDRRDPGLRQTSL